MTLVIIALYKFDINKYDCDYDYGHDYVIITTIVIMTREDDLIFS